MRIRATATAALTAALLTTGVAGSSPALAGEKPSHQANATAIQHAIAGKATAADLRVISDDPQLARTVPVSVRAGKPVITKASPPAGQNAAASRTADAAAADFQTKCLTVDYPLTNTSYLGDIIYTWHHKFSWCTANTVSGAEWSRVITASPYNRYDYFTDKSSVVYPQGLTTDVSFAPVGSPMGTINPGGAGSPYHSYLARSVNLCIAQYACYASNLPQSDLTIGRDNAYPAMTRAL
ncbi:hypothetical protein AB0929_40045 [Streptomyces massasporeus]|uniref:hypothetical protein n=1 Tax=Streptomyces massasporeus TaxID=67324 RepID=UPI0034567ECB